jgi:outer membrane protein OmpA-like peptidoglycan-associated protein
MQNRPERLIFMPCWLHFNFFVMRLGAPALLFFAGILTSYGQTDPAAMSEEYYRMGMEIYDFEHRIQAAELFQLACQANPRNTKAQLMAGKAIMLSVRREKSLPYFRRAYRLDAAIDPDILSLLGQAYQYSESFDSAILYFDKYRAELQQSTREDRDKKLKATDRNIRECQNARVYMAHPVNVKVTHLSSNINSEYEDYAPTINETGDLMVFTSRRQDDNSNESVADDHEYFEDVYVSSKVNGEWTKAFNPGPPLNTRTHNSSVNLDPQGDEIFIYRDDNDGDIFISYLREGRWTVPTPFAEINSLYHENSATVTEDGKTVYFSSNRPGGQGGMDLFSISRKANGKWGSPKNLGPVVNTELDEEYVFVSASGRHLYFSSDGHIGMGDLDLYRSSYDSAAGQWGEPLNLGYPINSVENDLYFVLDGPEKYAYISSIRPEANLGEEDIYGVDMSQWEPILIPDEKFEEAAKVMFVARTEIEFPAPDPNKVTVAPPDTTASVVTVTEVKEPVKVEEKPVPQPIGITVLDAKTGSPLDGATLLLKADQKQFPLSSKGNGMYFTAGGEPGVSSASIIKVEREGYLPYDLHLDFYPAKAEAVVKLTHRALEVPHVLNVYFPHDSDVPISVDPLRELRSLLTASPALQVEIAGHTDDKGPENYNQYLSQRRSDFVKRYLEKGGISPGRITAVGYGESRPVASNATMESRRLNRRTEFILSER